MSILPEEALDQLVCSDCHMYLSIFPVKVHPDKSVQCGRCSAEKEEGIQSVLYEMVASKYKFPCSNLFAGCQAELDPNSMKIHESKCDLAWYIHCPCCEEIIDSDDLLHHVKSVHVDETLEQRAFWINLDQWLVTKFYFYKSGNDCIYVGYGYTASNEQLKLSLRTTRKDETNLRHKFRLYFVDNNIHYDTGDLSDPDITIDLTKHDYSKNAILCLFDMWDITEKPQTNVQYPVMDGTANKALAIFRIDEISSLEVGQLYFSEFGYPIDSKIWRLVIEKVIDDAGVPHVAVCLLQQAVNNIQQEPCEIIAEVSLISSINPDLNVTRNLTDSKNGYVEDDHIQFEVRLEVLPFK